MKDNKSSLHVNHVKDTCGKTIKRKRPRQARDLSPPRWGERGRYHILDMILVTVLPLVAGDGPEEHGSYFV